MPTAAYAPVGYYRPAVYPRDGLRQPYPEIGRRGRALRRRGGRPDPFPPAEVLTPGPGWYGSDDGLALGTDSRRVVCGGERRRYYVDFSALGELAGGDELVAGGVTARADPFGLLASVAGVSGSRVDVWVYAASIAGTYRVQVTAPTAAGLVLVRSGPVVVLDPRVPPPVAVGEDAVPLIAALGWYATDDGLRPGWADRHRKDPGETRRFYMDFGGLAEVLAGDTIAAAQVTVDPAGPTLTGLAVSGTRVEVTLAGGTPDTDYGLAVTATLSGGAVVSRLGPVRVEAL